MQNGKVNNAHRDSDYERSFYFKLYLIVFLYVNSYALIFYSLGATFTFLLQLTSLWIFTPCLIWLEIKNYPRLSRLLFLLVVNIVILASVLGVKDLSGANYYFLAAILLPLLLFLPEDKQYIYLGQSIPLLAWIYEMWGPRPILPISWMPTNFPIYQFEIVNFVGAFIFIAVIVKLFLNDYHKSLKRVTKLSEMQEFILDGARLGAWDWWLDTNRVYFDKRWCEMLGLDYETTPYVLETWQKRLHPDDYEESHKAIAEYLEGKTDSYTNIHRLRHENGTWVWILDCGKISEYTEEGKPYRFSGTHYDITYLKEIESLQSNVEKLAKIGGWELDIQSSKTSWTDEVYRIHALPKGTPTNKFLGISFFPMHERERITRYIEESMKGKSYRETLEFIDNNGIFKWVEVTGVPVADANGNIYKIQGTIQDVTKEVAVEKLLEEAQSVAKLGSWSFDVKTKKVSWSKQLFELYPTDRNLGAPNLDQIELMIHPEDQELWKSEINRCLDYGHPFRFRCRSLFPSGRIIWQEIYGAAKFDDEGNVVSLSGTAQDITELAKAEEEAKIERNKATQNAKLASLGEMSAGIAHEINNPLSIITATIWGMPKFLNDQEKTLHKIKVIQKAASRISKIVLGLRKFSRSAEKSEYHPHSLATIIKEAIELSTVSSKSTEFQIESDLQTDGQVLCNEIEIEQVIINLISNGIDANKNNPEKWIKLSLEENSTSLILRVIDSGLGISAEVQAKIFEPFFTTKVIGEGTGLGLSIAKGILDDHKVSIEVLQDTSHTTFELRFPKYIESQDLDYGK